MIFADTLTLDRSAIRYRPSDGAAIAEVPVARTGIQEYAGWEVGRNDLSRVSVYRPPETVFDDDYIASMAHRPITDDHPPEAVTTDNWKKYAHGHTGETVRKDEANGLVYVPMMISDQGLIDKLKSGKREVSCGYSCELVWEDGVTPDGAPYQAKQTGAMINHIAVVKSGRAGSMCRFGDSWAEFNDEKEPLVGVKTITHDGVPIEVTDAAEAVINKLRAELVAAGEKLADAESETIAERGKVEARDGEIAVLKQSLADAAVTPAKLAEMVTARSALIAQAKAIHDADYANDADAAIMRKAVEAKMGEAGKALNDGAIAGAFAALSNSTPVTDAFRQTVADGVKPPERFDANAERDKRKAALNDAWNKPYAGQKD